MDMVDKNTKVQSDWINTMLTLLRDDENKSGTEILEKCGQQCFINSGFLDKSADIRRRTKGMDDEAKLEIIQKEILGEDENCPKIHKRDGIIYLKYPECVCRMASSEVEYDDYLCECTKGYTKSLIESVFDKQSEITILKTVLRGDDCCLLAIRLL